MEQTELYEQGWESFPWWWILLENLFFFVGWAIGFVGMYPLQIAGIPVISLAYAVFIFVTVGWLLKVHNCSTCYYYNKPRPRIRNPRLKLKSAPSTTLRAGLRR